MSPARRRRRSWDRGAVTSTHVKETSLLSQSSPRSFRIPLAAGAATLLAALAIAAPAGAATGVSSGADDVALNFTMTGAQVDNFKGAVAQDFHFSPSGVR
jgi:hypothetical protein